jgi:hypothetical protein
MLTFMMSSSQQGINAFNVKQICMKEINYQDIETHTKHAALPA